MAEPATTLDQLLAPSVERALNSAVESLKKIYAANYTEEPLDSKQLKAKWHIKNDYALQAKIEAGAPFHVKGVKTKYFYWSEILQWEHENELHM